MAARDYRKSQSNRHRESSPPSRWIWFLFGMLCGVVVGALPYLYPYFPAGVRSAMTQVVAERPSADGERPAKPRFEFYTMLPKMEVEVPDEALTAQGDGSAVAGQENAPANGAFVLQVGSFKHAKDADRHKAELALLGLEASVQAVVIDGTNTWHRVRLGPYSTLEQAHGDRQRLDEQRIESMVLRIDL